MKTAAECRKAAKNCRVLLLSEPNEEHRRMLWGMIEIWEMLARDRERQSTADLPNAADIGTGEMQREQSHSDARRRPAAAALPVAFGSWRQSSALAGAGEA